MIYQSVSSGFFKPLVGNAVLKPKTKKDIFNYIYDISNILQKQLSCFKINGTILFNPVIHSFVIRISTSIEQFLLFLLHFSATSKYTVYTASWAASCTYRDLRAILLEDQFRPFQTNHVSRKNRRIERSYTDSLEINRGVTALVREMIMEQ